MRYKMRYTVLAVLILTSVFLGSKILFWGEPGKGFSMSPSTGSEKLSLTGSTGRLGGNDYIETSVTYSQTIYAAAQDKDKPGAIVLVRDDVPEVAIAVTRLQHFPVNAPMLFITGNGTEIPDSVVDEIIRLDPEGVMMDNNVQVYLVGDISDRVVERVRNLGFKTRLIYADNPLDFTEELDEFLAVMETHKDIVMVAHIDHLEYAYSFSNWNAHMGDAVAFVTDDGVPEQTRRILERRWPNYPYIYVFAPQNIVDMNIMSELAKYGHVQRIQGETPQDMAVRWAGYKDSGRREAWWITALLRSTGWGISEPGHNVILAHPNDWRVIVPSGVLSHMGKHAFLLLTEDNGTIPDSVRGYLEILQPTVTHPSQQVFNYGWILGNQVSAETELELYRLLRTRVIIE